MAGLTTGRLRATQTDSIIGRIEFPGPDIDTVVFDLDGVVTDTAGVHEAAWKAVFDEFLHARAREGSRDFSEFTSLDYAHYVDGKPRYEGAEAFLRSRGIELPAGESSDGPGDGTVAALANRKNDKFRTVLSEQGVARYDSTVDVIHQLREAGIAVGLITASRNGRAVLEAGGVADLFDTVIDGVDAADECIAGKPAPDVFVTAARRLGSPPERTAIVEDSQAGVQAGRQGGFGFVLGVDRLDQAEALFEAGADAVVRDLSEVKVVVDQDKTARDKDSTPAGKMLADLPSGLDARDTIVDRLRHGTLVVFLDYDGTLSPIVDDPDKATMPASVRAALERLAGVVPVAIVSGRDLADVRERAALEGVHYAGSHGFEIVAPDGSPLELGAAGDFKRFLPLLDAAEHELQRMLHGLEGVVVERKRYAIAVHFRRAKPEAVEAVERAVDHVRDSAEGLRKTGGKKIFELRPGVDWDKGKALMALLEVPGLGGKDAVPLFVGDDLTDEDAFAAVNGIGVSVAVRGEDERETLAEYGLDTPEQVGELLAYIAERFAEKSER